MADQTNFRGNPNWSLIPEHTRNSIRLYVERHLHPGNFVHAVMSNNFILASRLADEKNRAQLADIGRFVFESCPSDCCGNPQNVKAWLTDHRNEEELG